MRGVKRKSLAFQDEWEHFENVCVDSRNVSFCAPHAPCDESNDVPPLVLRVLTNQGGATVAIAGVLALFTSCADFALAEQEVARIGSALPLESSSQGRLASPTLVEGNVNFVLDELETSTRFVLAPTGNPTPCSGSIGELEVEHVVACGEASCVDIPIASQTNRLVEEEESDVV